MYMVHTGPAARAASAVAAAVEAASEGGMSRAGVRWLWQRVGGAVFRLMSVLGATEPGQMELGRLGVTWGERGEDR